MNMDKYENGEDNVILDVLKGQYILVDTGDVPDEKPSWYNEKKYRLGQEFVKQYFGSILFAHMTSLLMNLYLPQVLKPLIFTEKSNTPKKSYQRYMETAIHVMSWYRGNVWANGDVARDSIQLVKRYHSSVATSINSCENRLKVDQIQCPFSRTYSSHGDTLRIALSHDLNSIPDSSLLQNLDVNYSQFHTLSIDTHVPYINQLDMYGTQFTFIGLILLYPEKFGLSQATEDDLEGFIHLWRCYGYLLGIQDRYNFCQQDNLHSVRHLATIILNRMVKPSWKSCLTWQYEEMCRIFALGAQHYIPGCSFESMLLIISWIIDMPFTSVRSHLSFIYHISFYWWKFLFYVVGNTTFGNWFINNVIELNINLAVNPPTYWPKRLRPPSIKHCKRFWIKQ